MESERRDLKDHKENQDHQGLKVHRATTGLQGGRDRKASRACRDRLDRTVQYRVRRGTLETLDHKDPKVSRGCQGLIASFQGHRENRASKALRDQRELIALYQGQRGRKAFKVFKGLPERTELRESRAYKDHRVQRGPPG